MFFFLFGGKKQIETQIGFVADYCHYCRGITAFAMERIGVVTHVYFISFGKEVVVGHAKRCLSCRAIADSDPIHFDRVADKFEGDVDRLAHETFSSIYQKFRERLDLEERIRADPFALEPEVRKEMLLEPFRLTSGYFDGVAGREGLRLLALVLRPLEPTEDEIRDCLNHFRERKFTIGGQLRTAKVLSAIYPEKPGEFSY